MLKTVANTWKCDQCGTEVVAAVDPFYKVTVKPGALVQTVECELDICQTCIALVALDSVGTYVAGLPPAP